MTKTDTMISRLEAARRAGVKVQTLDYWLSNRPELLKCHKGGRVFLSREALDKLIAARRIVKGEPVAEGAGA